MGLVLGLAGLTCLGGGGYIVYSAVQAYDASVQAAEAPMPMPAEDFAVAPDQAVAAARQETEAPVRASPKERDSAAREKTVDLAALEATAPHRREIALTDPSGRDITGAPEEYCTTPKSWLPNRVYIPSMCVQAPVLTASAPGGAMQLPENPAKLAWLSSTAAIDATQGTSVLSGHVNMWGKKGALYDLALMKPGTRIFVTDGYSRPHSFAVSSLKAYRKKDIPEDIFTTTGARRVALVTCGGRLIHGANGNHYEDNVVAVATEVPTQAST